MSREQIKEISKRKQDYLKFKPFADDLRQAESWCELDGILNRYQTVKNLSKMGYRKQEWISVEERLPTEEEYRDEYGELIPILVCEKDTQYPYRAMYDGTEWGDGLMKIRGITHWMPLPEPPKMKGGE